MLATRVTYRVRPDFVATNRANIQAVMSELAAKGDVGVRYSAFLRADGVTFVHVVIARDREAMQIVPSLEAFQAFRAGLKGGAETPPDNESWSLVGSSVPVI